MSTFAVIAAVVIFGAWSAGAVFLGKYWGEADLAEYKVKEAEAQRLAQVAKEEAKQEGENVIANMQGAYDAGLEKGREDAGKVQGRTRSVTQQYASVFQNPACQPPAAAFDLYVAALKGLRSGVVLPPETKGGDAVDTGVPNSSGGANAVTGVAHPPNASGPPPKPVPRKKAGG